MLDTEKVPDHIKGILDRYINHRLNPGQFVTCVLANDILTACDYADSECAEQLFAIVKYVRNQLPINSYGSYTKVQEYLINERA